MLFVFCLLVCFSQGNEVWNSLTFGHLVLVPQSWDPTILELHGFSFEVLSLAYNTVEKC